MSASILCRVFFSLWLPLLVLALPASGIDTLALEEAPDRFVVQRQPAAGGYAGSFALAGTFTGQAAAVEARAVSDVGGSPVTPWRTVDPAPAAGTWSGSLDGIPQGGWYRLQVRSAAEPTVAVAGVGRFGVGMVVVAIGQSNMVKLFTEDEGDGSVPPPFETPRELTWRLGYGEPPGFEYSRHRNAEIPVSWGEVTGTGGIRLANGLQQALGVPVLVLDYAIDWTGLLQHWNNTSGWFRGWQMLAEGLETVGAVEAVLWHQGAFDAQRSSTTVAGYKAGLDTLYTQITDIVGGHGSLPFVMAIQNRGDYGDDLTWDDGYGTVRRAQLEWIDETPHGFAAGSSMDMDLSWRPNTGSGHFWAYGYEEMADRFVRGVLHAIAHPGYELGVRGGELAGASIHGRRVVVEVTHDHGDRLVLEEPSAPIEGFSLTDGEWVVDDGSGPQRNELEVLSATLSDPERGNWAELELAEEPAGPVRLRYLYGQNPYHAKPTVVERRLNGNCLYDDFFYHPERGGLPINGTAQELEVAPAGGLELDAELVVVAEGGGAVLQVRLAEAPEASVTVSAEAVGDVDLVITSDPVLSFDTSDWDVYQPISLQALPDTDSSPGSAALRLRAAGYLPRSVELWEEDLAAFLPADPALLLWLELEGTSGRVAADASGRGHHGSLGGRVELGLAGVAGGAVGTRGPGGWRGDVGDGVTVDDLGVGVSYDEATVAVWYRLPAGAHDGYLFSWGGSYRDRNSLSAYLDVGRGIRVRVHDATDRFSTVEIAPPGFDDELWHHLAVTKDAAGTAIYFDGALVATHGMGAGTVTPPVGFAVGLNEIGLWGLEASFDDARVYERALGAGEVYDLYAEAAP